MTQDALIRSSHANASADRRAHPSCVCGTRDVCSTQRPSSSSRAADGQPSLGLPRCWADRYQRTLCWSQAWPGAARSSVSSSGEPLTVTNARPTRSMATSVRSPAPGALHASFDDYRAMQQDIALDDIDAAEGRRLTMPVPALHPRRAARGTDGASARLSGRQDRSGEMIVAASHEGPGHAAGR